MTTPTTSTFLEIAGQLFNAVTAGDVAAVEQLYAPECIVWHNFDNAGQTVAENLATLRWLTTNVANLRYEEVRRQELPNGFLQQHVLRGTSVTGEQVDMPTCMIGTIADGKIIRLEEYLDSAHIGRLLTDQ
jgi:ketosteroid isomerase-like protein